MSINRVKQREGMPLLTSSGRLVYPLDLDPSDIDINDIAYALSNLCRYGGHCKPPYNVADHSIRVSHHCLKKDALSGLLHDASEAYLIDLPRPVKTFLSDYRQYEEKAQRVIAEKFGIPWPFPASVHEADNRILINEMRDLMPVLSNVSKSIRPYKEVIKPRTASQSRRAFIARFKELANDSSRQTKRSSSSSR